MFPELDFWDDASCRTPAGQMAVDEAFLLHMTRPALRLYEWAIPAATFGYSQRLQKIRPMAPDLPLVRRWTGGGLVIHGCDLTLAVVIPQDFPSRSGSAQEIYDRIHCALIPILEEVAGGVRMAGPADRVEGPACFTSPAVGDVLAGGSKLCGGAIRRTKAGLLYQGSIQCRPLPDRFRVARALGQHVLPFEAISEVDRNARDLEEKKYSRPEWLDLR